MVRKITKARCSICSHPERARIELSRVSGVSLRDIAATFNVNLHSVWRHMVNHVSNDQRAAYIADVDLKAVAERARAENLSLLDYLAITRGILMSQLQLAASCNDRNGTAALAGRMNETLKLLATLTGELLKISPVNITPNTAVFLASPLYAELEKMLVDVLSDHPTALAAVIDGLRQLEERAPAAEYPAAAALAPAVREINPHA